MTDAFAGSEIVLKNPPFELCDRLKALLQWPNPEYVKRIEAGRSVYNVPRDIILWKRKGDEFIVPFGMLRTLFKWGVEIAPETHLTDDSGVFSGPVDNLYDYQENALKEALKDKKVYWLLRVVLVRRRSVWRFVVSLDRTRYGLHIRTSFFSRVWKEQSYTFLMYRWARSLAEG